jgi:hypothetical protein
MSMGCCRGPACDVLLACAFHVLVEWLSAAVQNMDTLAGCCPLRSGFLCVCKYITILQYYFLILNLPEYISNRSPLASEMEACLYLYLWGSHLSSDRLDKQTTRTTIVLAS